MSYDLKVSENTVQLYIPEDDTENNITIPSGLTTIGQNAFRYANKINSVLLSGIVAIKDNAFYRSDIKSVTFTESLKEIGNRAFVGCNELHDTITLPKSLVQMGTAVFCDCNKLETAVVNCPELETLPDRTFKSCAMLKDVRLSNNITAIGQEAFTYCPELSAINLPDNLETMHAFAFKNSGLQRIFFNNKLKWIGGFAFANCPKLSSINFVSTAADSKLETIEDYAFAHTAIYDFTMPASVKYLGEGVFRGCEELKRVNFLSDDQVKFIRQARDVFFECKKLQVLDFPSFTFKCKDDGINWDYEVKK